MSANCSPLANVDRPKLTKKKSLKEKLFSRRHHESKPKLKNASSTGRKQRWMSLTNTLSDNIHTRKSSKFVGFIHEAFEKLTHPTQPRSLSHPNMNININQLIPKSRWKPSLKVIYNDPLLLLALIAFMERSYNEESILFIQSVHQLNSKIDAFMQNPQKVPQTEIDDQIYCIFELYIAHTAEYQINLSSECFFDISNICNSSLVLTYTMDQKRRVFNAAVAEIQRLITSSVLCLFYDSHEFQGVAQRETPLSQPVVPPIILSASRSTLSLDDHAVVMQSPESDIFDNDGMVYTNDDYFDSLNIVSSPSSKSSIF